MPLFLDLALAVFMKLKSVMKGFINFQFIMHSYQQHNNTMKGCISQSPSSYRYEQKKFQIKRNSFPLKHSLKQIITSKKIKLKIQSINKNGRPDDEHVNQYQSKFRQIEKLFNLKVNNKKDGKRKVSFKVMSPESIPEFQISKCGFSSVSKTNKSTDLKRSTDKSFKLCRKMQKNRSFDKVQPQCSSIRPFNYSCLTETANEEQNIASRKSSYLKQNTKKLNPRILMKKKKERQILKKYVYEKEKIKGWEVEEDIPIF